MGNNKHANKKVLGSILMDSFKSANREYKLKDIRNDIGNRFGVSISYNQAWRVRSFVQCCRPIIIVDAAHLKSGYLGTNLVAVAMDELTFISDHAPSIAHGISNVFPEAFHAFCAHYLFMNVKGKSSKLKNFEWHYWKMVKAYCASDFQDHLSVFQRRLKAAYKYLEDVGFQKFYRNRAEHVRFSYLTSNSVESINALSKHARKLPVCMLLECFRASGQDWYFKHRNTSVSLSSTVTPYAERKLAKRTKKSRRWQTIPSTNNLIEVRGGRKNGMVNLEDRVCSCGQWQLSGIPCGHVIAAARRFEVEDVTCYEVAQGRKKHLAPSRSSKAWKQNTPCVLAKEGARAQEAFAPTKWDASTQTLTCAYKK
ncbi:uncharacterized protein [Rutidosis leptorrhynchoides]|uniref:uncharacterized protein n=1 Tax=Rutidosis leptorrhynchoides TaxID=125765 RepID=UPI003A99ADAA